jgi:nucleoid DNA-binding protein
MRKPEIAKRIARQTGLTEGEAADRLDGLVSELISRLRRGKDAELPGLGRFSNSGDGAVQFRHSRRPRVDR